MGQVARRTLLGVALLLPSFILVVTIVSHRNSDLASVLISARPAACARWNDMQSGQIKTTLIRNGRIFRERHSLSAPRTRIRCETPLDDLQSNSVPQENRQLNLDPKKEAAWRSVKKPLLRLGSAGIQDSHANSLLDLLSSHGLVKVKFNMHAKDRTVKDFAQSLIERAKEIRPTKYSEIQPMIFAEKEYQRIVLFATSEAAGEAMSASK
eukprot:jgi/Bigna1/70286/fgenesh1_pg.11_\